MVIASSPNPIHGHSLKIYGPSETEAAPPTSSLYRLRSSFSSQRRARACDDPRRESRAAAQHQRGHQGGNHRQPLQRSQGLRPLASTRRSSRVFQAMSAITPRVRDTGILRGNISWRRMMSEERFYAKEKHSLFVHARFV